MKQLLLKVISIIILCSWVFGFGHVLHMGSIHNTHCIGNDTSHTICKTFINIQAEQKLVQTVIMVFVIVITILFVKTLVIKNYIGYVFKKYIPPPLQELFSAGILNPKAP